MQKFVLIVLADAHNGHTGQCNPSISRMARLTGYSGRAVMNALAALEAQGYICARKTPGRSTHYELSFQESTGESGSPVKPQKDASKTLLTGERGSPPTSESHSPVNEVHQCTTFTPPVNEVHHTPEPRSPDPEENLERNREDEDGGVVRVGAGWVVTFDWKPRHADVCRARAAGIPQTLIDDPGVLEDFRLKYSEAPQRDQAFGQRWVRWLVNEHRNPTPRPVVVGDSLRRWANGDE